jgi:alpha-glucosidase
MIQKIPDRYALSQGQSTHPDFKGQRIMRTPKFIALWLCFLLSPALADNPVAHPEAIVQFGNARFTVLTSQLIRMEYSEHKKFEDRASLTFVNRELPVPHFKKQVNGNQLRITTDNVQLIYTEDGRAFNEQNLSATIFYHSKAIANWFASKPDPLNLKGTMRTLDQANGWNFENKLEQGLISRSGWSLVDDTGTNLFDGASDWNWVAPRRNPDLDWYLFAHGHDYKQALKDFTRVAGKIPIPPKYAFGYWWSRYWIYNDDEMRQLVKNMRDFQIPLDVLIVDMDWHETYGFSANVMEKDSQDQWKGWTGYTWNKNLFPEPKQFIEWSNQQNLKTALNLHPASGIPTMEEKYAEFAKAYDFKNTDEYIPFNMSDKKWANVYFETLLKPMEEWGIDFWWLDWQQFLQDKHIPSLSNTWWLNYTFFTNMEKSGKRPMIFHRWGGLGNHRYPIGFSGDANTNWETLDFEIYFTATAANVGYAYWSHDIGGHISNDKPTDGELYLRWMQFGALSPILRTHASKISLIERRPWMFPQHFFAMRDAIQFRYSLTPYIYAAARETYDTGLAFIHPLYYDYNDQEAYEYKGQYAFGKDMIAAPVVTPVNPSSQLAAKKIWLPRGEWFEYSSGQLLQGNRSLDRHYALDEIPLFIKAGSIIPMNPAVQNLQEKPDHMVLVVIPGGELGKQHTSNIYEDDENTTDYQKNYFSVRQVTSEVINAKTLKITLAPTMGNFSASTINSGKIDIKLLNRSLPSTVSLNSIPRNVASEYLPDELASVIHLSDIKPNEKVEIIIQFDQSLRKQNALFNGNKGFLRRAAAATETLKFTSALTDWGGTLPNEVYKTGNIVNLLRYHPESALLHMEQLNELKKSLPKVLRNIPNIPQTRTLPLIEFLEL